MSLSSFFLFLFLLVCMCVYSFCLYVCLYCCYSLDYSRFSPVGGVTSPASIFRTSFCNMKIARNVSCFFFVGRELFIFMKSLFDVFEERMTRGVRRSDRNIFELAKLIENMRSSRVLQLAVKTVSRPVEASKFFAGWIAIRFSSPSLPALSFVGFRWLNSFIDQRRLALVSHPNSFLQLRQWLFFDRAFFFKNVRVTRKGRRLSFFR